MQKKDLKEHTTRVLGEYVHPKERYKTSEKPKPSFGKRSAEGDGDKESQNLSKKINLEEDLNNSTEI